jgi:hypothetical protein
MIPDRLVVAGIRRNPQQEVGRTRRNQYVLRLAVHPDRRGRRSGTLEDVAQRIRVLVARLE